MSEINAPVDEEAPYTEAQLAELRVRQQIAIAVANLDGDTDKVDMLASMDLNTFDDYDLRRRVRRLVTRR